MNSFRPLFAAAAFGLCLTISSTYSSNLLPGSFASSATYSAKRLVKSAADVSYRLPYQRHGADTIRIIAFMVEFNKGQPDTSENTTGNGLFGINEGGDGTPDDKKERNRYDNDTVYRYDNLPHDSNYVAAHLEFAKRYFSTVSRNRLVLEYTVVKDSNKAFTVPNPMKDYSPPGKRDDETYQDFNMRQTITSLKFVKDAINSAENSKRFSSFRRDSITGAIVDSLGKKVVFLIVHAGASQFTDVGEDRLFGNTPSDMFDWFVSADAFHYFADTIGLNTPGVMVTGRNGNRFLLDEIMMISETANQDNLNWGINGILVNQIARQIGIPDLYSTSTGATGVGNFCIMDVGFITDGNGFIPPWPSAWVRAFMGWDVPVVAKLGGRQTASVKAVNISSDADTSILMVPLNDHEYYLIENRQRSLTSDPQIFNYDTSKEDHVRYISPFTPVNLNQNISLATNNDSKVILSVKNYDVGISASGVLIWHIDENLVRERLRYNIVNADSTNRAVSLVEADGINDLGITFMDALGQNAWDYGGAEDVFPHRTFSPKGTTTDISEMTPFTRPSTGTKDGGKTFLQLKIQRRSSATLTDTSAIRDYYVVNYRDSSFSIILDWDYLSPHWPKSTISGDSLFEPLVCDLIAGNGKSELIGLSKSGRLFVWPVDSTSSGSLGNKTGYSVLRNMAGDTLRDSLESPITDQISFFDSLDGVFVFPTAINSRLYVPTKSGVTIYSGISGQLPVFTTRSLNARPSTYVCKPVGSLWAIGDSAGRVLFADTATNAIVDSIQLDQTSPVCALAAIRGEPQTVVAIQNNGKLSVCRSGVGIDTTITINKGIPPFTLVTGDLDCAADSASEIVVCDSRHGLWAFSLDLVPLAGWNSDPNDWPNAYALVDSNRIKDRTAYPVNLGAPAIADIDGDGWLDIIVGGTNGLYAFNYKGVLLHRWPAYLDKRYWYQRSSITTSPTIVASAQGDPLVVFSAPTGVNETFGAALEIDSVRRSVVYFTRADHSVDSVKGLSSGFIDTMLLQGDSIYYEYVLPGSFIDAFASDAQRPEFKATLSNVGVQWQSFWPITVGTNNTTAPLFYDADFNNTLDLFALSSGGLVYRWELPQGAASSRPIWPQTGYSAERTFAYDGTNPLVRKNQTAALLLHSYPNPSTGAKSVVFRYQFSHTAKNVTLDIYTYTGFHVFSKSNLSGSFPGANEIEVNVERFGPGVYRCRIQAEINGRTESKFWKMAITK